MFIWKDGRGILRSQIQAGSWVFHGESCMHFLELLLSRIAY